jgi:hypothetical protein
MRGLLGNGNRSGILKLVVDPNPTIALDVIDLGERSDDRDECLRDVNGITFEGVHSTGK